MMRRNRDYDMDFSDEDVNNIVNKTAKFAARTGYQAAIFLNFLVALIIFIGGPKTFNYMIVTGANVIGAFVLWRSSKY